MNLLLENLRWTSGGRDHYGDLRLSRGCIVEAGRGLALRRHERTLDASGYLALPGLVNAHDHLDLNLFPALGDPPYGSYYDWVEDVYRPRESPMRDVLRLGLRDRLWWGAYRNLVSGVTTVVHHDPYYGWVFGRQLLGRRLVRRKLFGRPYPVRVLKRYGWCHSLGYGEDPVRAHRRSRGRPFILHAAEGVDERAYQEVDRLDELGLLGPATVLVHAIALTEAQRRRLIETETSVVWCPATHLRLYGETTPVRELRGKTPLTLGTDSTLTGSPTLLDEIASASSTGFADPEELLAMVTETAAKTFHLDDGRGSLRVGGLADLVLLPDRGGMAAESFALAGPADVHLVLVGAAPRLAAPEIAASLALGPPNVRIAGAAKWIYGDFPGLRRRIAQTVGTDVLARVPLWQVFAQPSAAGELPREPPQ